MDYDHVKKQLGYGIQTESKDNAIKAIEQLQQEIERMKGQQEPVAVVAAEMFMHCIWTSTEAADWAQENVGANLYAAPPDLAAKVKELEAKYYVAESAVTAAHSAVENCRLYAARNRNEEWATHILRFCTASGVVGSPLRESDQQQSRISELTELIEKVEKMTIERCAGVCKTLDRKEMLHATGYGPGYLTYTASDCEQIIRVLPTGQIKLEELI